MPLGGLFNLRSAPPEITIKIKSQKISHQLPFNPSLSARSLAVTYCARIVPWLVMGMNTPLPQWMSSTAERRVPRNEPAVPVVVVACEET